MNFPNAHAANQVKENKIRSAFIIFLNKILSELRCSSSQFKNFNTFEFQRFLLNRYFQSSFAAIASWSNFRGILEVLHFTFRSTYFQSFCPDQVGRILLCSITIISPLFWPYDSKDFSFQGMFKMSLPLKPNQIMTSYMMEWYTRDCKYGILKDLFGDGINESHVSTTLVKLKCLTIDIKVTK